MVGLVFVALALSAGAAELRLDFTDVPEGEAPPGFRNALAGEGNPADWRIGMGDVPLLLSPLSPQAPQTARKPVLTQADRTPGRERFPMLVYELEEFGDFRLTTRFRILGGEDEQMAGIAFRLQDERNFYVIRASALGKNLRYYKVVDGRRSDLIGPSVDIPTNVWHELTIECRGNEILCQLNGQVALPPLQDFSFGSGKMAFWTMSDSICEFAEVRIQYTPQIPLSQSILAAALEKYSRVRDLRLYTLTTEGETVVVASKNEADKSEAGGEAELGAIRDGTVYFGRGKKTVTVVMPLRDRNGDPVAAARVVLDRFPGQTENSAIVRAKPVVKMMENRVRTSTDPFR